MEKPDPRIFRSAMNRLGVRPEQSLHIGDLYHIDVVGAQAAGMHAVLLDPTGLHPEKTVLRIPVLEDLGPSIDALQRPPL